MNTERIVSSSISARNGAINSGVGSPWTVFMLIAILAALLSSQGSTRQAGTSTSPSSRAPITR